MAIIINKTIIIIIIIIIIIVIIQDRRLVRRWGYGLKGTRACIKRYVTWAPRVSAIVVMGSGDIHCISTMRGSVNGDKFIQFLQDDLVPMLQPFDGMNLKSIVVMGGYERKRHRNAESACLSQLGMLKLFVIVFR